MRRCWWLVCSNERLHVGPHDVNDPAHLGGVPYLVHGSFLFTVGTAKRLNRCFHSDLRAELEAIRYCLRRAIDAQLARHETLTVERADKSHIVARDLQGAEHMVSPTQARSFSVHERGQIEIASGDKLLLTGNRRDADFRATNGELVKVRSIGGDRIQLEDGRTLPSNYREFDHGYAITAHRSQGKTVDAVVLSGDTMKQEQFYVAASRGRDEITIITSDVDGLRESLGISSARPSATELAREQAQVHPAPEHCLAQLPIQSIEPPTPLHEISIGHEIGISL